MTQPKKCFNCGYEEDPNEPWMQFHEIGEKNYCSMCINIALLYREEYEHAKSKGFEIVTNPKYKCVECKEPASKDIRQYAFKGQSICLICLSMALDIKRKVEKDAEKFEKWWSRREN